MDTSQLVFAKPTPRILERRAKQQQLAREERTVRFKVRARDGDRCFYPHCRQRATELHHIVPRSVRGKTIWRTDDLISACARHHRYFKSGLIRVTGNPDRGPVRVILTRLGRQAGMKLQRR